MTNMDKLYASVAANGPVCVGLDTEFSYLPADVVGWAIPARGDNKGANQHGRTAEVFAGAAGH